MGIDDLDGAFKTAPGIGLGLHHHRLTNGNVAEVAFGHLDHSPNGRDVGDPEQHIAGVGAHALGRIALQHDPVPRRRPLDGDRSNLRALHRSDRHLGHIEIDQSLPRAAAERLVAANGLGLDGGEIIGRRRRDRRAVDLHQRLTGRDAAASRDVSDLLHEALATHRDHRYAPLVELDHARSLHEDGERSPLGRLRFHTSALNFAGG